MTLFFFYTTGHIGICVPDVDAACKRFEELNVEFIKKPNQGGYIQLNCVCANKPEIHEKKQAI